ncbi:precorrin-6y C5,15-methyltransferase (decarboxylating) subunit CbiE [Aquimarina hainanensis]|uniref:Precorrin-6y C5,15-methyltransferase (Decarboxylating) subunit CbiE n=2 Tax=Aquimarina hainanensis TaxID=1578017 RepID=A0ABW5NAK5_9FLAO
MRFNIIGIGNKIPDFNNREKDLISKNRVFSGGKRHYNLVKTFLPEGHHWIYIQGAMANVFEQYEKAENTIVVFASGNPLFYGFANTLKNRYPTAHFTIISHYSAIQLLADKMALNSNSLQTVSVHGRSWEALDNCIIKQPSLIGVLTDKNKSPDKIAARLLRYGYDNYTVIVGEELEGDKERLRTLSLEETSKESFYPLNCVILVKKKHRKVDFGLKDQSFRGLAGRPGMITKMPVRLTSLHLLEVLHKKVLWDIGFCTGSISIEARLKNPNLKVIAFEKRESCQLIMQENEERFGVFEIEKRIGDFFEQDIEELPEPDTVFIGGHGGRLAELLERLVSILPDEGIIVFNAVREESKKTFSTVCSRLGLLLVENMAMTIDNHNTIHLFKAIKK